MALMYRQHEVGRVLFVRSMFQDCLQAPFMIVNVPEILEVVAKWTVCMMQLAATNLFEIFWHVLARVSDEAIWQHSFDCDVLSNQPLHGFSEIMMTSFHERD